MIRRRAPLKRTPIKRKVPSFAALERVDWKSVMEELGRKPIPKKRSKPRRGREENPEYLEWLRNWPCFVCLCRWAQGSEYILEAYRYTANGLCNLSCGPTEAAHVGVHGLSQKCSDREAIPLGAKHHLHPTAGGGPDSHHALGKTFWEYHGISREETLALLHRLYHEETGRIA